MNPEYICVLDFEATCDDQIKDYGHEVIEFPSVLLKWNGSNYDKVAEFQKFCKPIGKPTLTKFCKELTGIKQIQVDSGEKFPDVLSAHKKWLIGHTNGNVTILCCGYWDLKSMMPNECNRWNIIPEGQMPGAFIPDAMYLKMINIKVEYSIFYKDPRSLGMDGMLAKLSLTLDGRHHSGIDDCRNISKILQKMISDGYNITNQSFYHIEKKSYQNYMSKK